jgi:hypothetical protein
MVPLQRESAMTSQEKQEHWSRLVAEQKISGQSVVEFCQTKGINEHTFGYWRVKLSAPAKVVEKTKPAFVRVERRAAENLKVKVILSGQVELLCETFPDPKWLYAITEALRAQRS